VVERFSSKRQLCIESHRAKRMSKNITQVKKKYHSWMSHICLPVSYFRCHPSDLENCLHNGNAKKTYIPCLTALFNFPYEYVDCDK
jgi:hypothetical protein